MRPRRYRIVMARAERFGPGEEARALSPGDFILAHRHHVIAGLISLAQKRRFRGRDSVYAHWSHAAIVEAADSLIEAEIRRHRPQPDLEVPPRGVPRREARWGAECGAARPGRRLRQNPDRTGLRLPGPDGRLPVPAVRVAGALGAATPRDLHEPGRASPAGRRAARKRWTQFSLCRPTWPSASTFEKPISSSPAREWP